MGSVRYARRGVLLGVGADVYVAHSSRISHLASCTPSPMQCPRRLRATCSRLDGVDECSKLRDARCTLFHAHVDSCRVAACLRCQAYAQYAMPPPR
jgi:hypothetical protein